MLLIAMERMAQIFAKTKTSMTSNMSIVRAKIQGPKIEVLEQRDYAVL